MNQEQTGSADDLANLADRINSGFISQTYALRMSLNTVLYGHYESPQICSFVNALESGPLDDLLRACGEDECAAYILFLHVAPYDARILTRCARHVVCAPHLLTFLFALDRDAAVGVPFMLLLRRYSTTTMCQVLRSLLRTTATGVGVGADTNADADTNVATDTNVGANTDTDAEEDCGRPGDAHPIHAWLTQLVREDVPVYLIADLFTIFRDLARQMDAFETLFTRGCDGLLREIVAPMARRLLSLRGALNLSGTRATHDVTGVVRQGGGLVATSLQSYIDGVAVRDAVVHLAARCDNADGTLDMERVSVVMVCGAVLVTGTNFTYCASLACDTEAASAGGCCGTDCAAPRCAVCGCCDACQTRVDAMRRVALRCLASCGNADMVVDACELLHALHQSMGTPPATAVDVCAVLARRIGDRGHDDPVVADALIRCVAQLLFVGSTALAAAPEATVIVGSCAQGVERHRMRWPGMARTYLRVMHSMLIRDVNADAVMHHVARTVVTCIQETNVNREYARAITRRFEADDDSAFVRALAREIPDTPPRDVAAVVLEHIPRHLSDRVRAQIRRDWVAPEPFKDPITCCVMDDPVVIPVTATGSPQLVVDRRTLMALPHGETADIRVHPYTRASFRIADVVADDVLKNEIQSFQEDT
jgi:hypothetical protein